MRARAQLDGEVGVPSSLPYLRAGLLLACSAVAAVELGPRGWAAATGGLLLAAVAGSAPLTGRPRQLQPLVEAGLVGVVGAALGAVGAVLPALVAPAAAAGLVGGARLGASALLVAGVPVAVGAGLGPPSGAAAVRLLPWAVVLAAVALLGSRLRTSRRRPQLPASPYEDAHRILSELSVVARQLSLGLDARTLAGSLLEELDAEVEHDAAAVLTRSAGGRFVLLVGDVPADVDADPVVEEAWLSGGPVSARRDGTWRLALPVLMGRRVVALVVLLGGSALVSAPALARARAVVGRAGPRLASALLFEEVRLVATADERHRVARDVHDGVAQDMASVGYVLDDLAERATAAEHDPHLAEDLRALRQHLQTLVSDLRSSIFDLRSDVAEGVGLGTALGDHLRRVCAQWGLALHLVVEEQEDRLPLAVEVELLRIVQEAVTNVRKHAEARTLWVTCRVDPPDAEVVVRDDGRGLQQAGPGSVGLTGMRERAARIGATLVVREPAEGGVEVAVVLQGRESGPRRRGRA